MIYDECYSTNIIYCNFWSMAKIKTTSQYCVSSTMASKKMQHTLSSNLCTYNCVLVIIWSLLFHPSKRKTIVLVVCCHRDLTRGPWTPHNNHSIDDRSGGPEWFWLLGAVWEWSSFIQIISIWWIWIWLSHSVMS